MGGEVLRVGCEVFPRSPGRRAINRRVGGGGAGRGYRAGGFAIMVSQGMGAFPGGGHGTSLGDVQITF